MAAISKIKKLQYLLDCLFDFDEIFYGKHIFPLPQNFNICSEIEMCENPRWQMADILKTTKHNNPQLLDKF